MGRIVLFYLFQFVRRILQSFTAAPRAESRYDEAEVGLSRTGVALVSALVLYIVCGLGYYAKVHCWDTLTEEQKGVVVQAMIVNEQSL